MSGHTPGPWVANIEHSGDPRWRVESERDHGVANDGWSIAEFFGPDAEGNAKRCAAAPALLTELKLLVAALEPLERDGGWPLDGAGIATLNAARAAIAKAEGRS